MKKKCDITRDKILDMAELIVLNEGAMGLSFNNVAKKSKVSKGGVMHHFRSKEKLLIALVDRHIKRIFADRDKIRKKYPAGLIGDIQAYLIASTKSVYQEHPLNSAILAASVTSNNKKLLEPIKAFHESLVERMKTEHSDWIELFSLRMVIQGMWYMNMFQILPLKKAEFQMVVDHVMSSLDELQKRSLNS
jgi:AcrR family transcriptional regulator